MQLKNKLVLLNIFFCICPSLHAKLLSLNVSYPISAKTKSKSLLINARRHLCIHQLSHLFTHSSSMFFAT